MLDESPEKSCHLGQEGCRAADKVVPQASLLGGPAKKKLNPSFGLCYSLTSKWPHSAWLIVE